MWRWGVLLSLLIATPVLGQPSEGKRVYGERCVACHGIGGGGDGPAAAAIRPPPRNFRDAAFWRTRTTKELTRTVRDGRPGTLMQAFRDVLSEAEIEAVVTYLETFRPRERRDDATGGHDEVPDPRASEDAARR